MINKIGLKNFKCYHKKTFKLGKLTVFCGSNSVGKSTAIQALAIPFQSKFNDEASINSNLVELGSVNEIFSTYAGKETNLEILLEFDNGHCCWGFDDLQKQNSLQNHLSLKSMTLDKKDILNQYFIDKGFQFLQAERFGPRTYLNNNKSESICNWLGSKGEYVNEVLTKISDSGERLDTNDKRILENEQGPAIRRNIINWMGEISPGFNFESGIVSEADISHAQFQAYGSEKTSPINMGFGLSYSLGIVCALLITKPGGLVVIENPEAHLHPRGQSYLGRLIAKSALAGVQVIIETHSDHLLNGIRVAARLDTDYQEGIFKVFYISGHVKSESQVEEITIGNKGELSSWPEGFFDQKAYDVKTLLKGEEVTELGVRR